MQALSKGEEGGDLRRKVHEERKGRSRKLIETPRMDGQRARVQKENKKNREGSNRLILGK